MMSKPKRIQMTRKKPWRCDNPDAVKVDRSTKWGNPFKIGETAVTGQSAIDAESATGLFRDMLSDPQARSLFGYPDDLSPLRGKDLACWCSLDSHCHADVLLEAANE